MTSYLSSIGTTLAAGALSYALGGQILQNVYQGEEAFKGTFGRISMQLSCLAFSYASSYVMYNDDSESNNTLFSSVTSIAGVFAAMRFVDNAINGDSNRFETLLGRVVETTGSLGASFVAVRVGTALGITPSDVVYYTALGISYAAQGALLLTSAILSALASKLIG
ncbi:MAG: hypothetical protein S4CHLAM7_06680 [Chlamydiae bacterium]|nr:hypothetical protein [Chlamydiota bacterium]